MANKKNKPVQPVTKPFLKGSPYDERTVRAALGFFGLVAISILMGFLVSSMMNFGAAWLRILLNIVVEALILVVFFNQAAGRGADAVARGEILYQRQEKGQTVSASEKAVCFHPLKGFLTGILGTLPLLICAILLALTTSVQHTGAGALPSWLNIYERRAEVGDPLVAYTVTNGMGLTDVVRLITRVGIMPFVSMVGAENRFGMLLLERLSPLVVLLPAAAYGCGYLSGVSTRTRVHTEIATNDRKRKRREKKERKLRIKGPKGPEQLN